VQPHGAPVALAEGVNGIQLPDVVRRLVREGRGIKLGQVIVRR